MNKNTIPEPARIKVARAELRNRKIILVLEPDLLSNEVFAVNPYYDEGEEKNKLQDIEISIRLTEKKGELNIDTCQYSGTFYTTGHRQIHSVNSLYIDKKDKAIAEILKIQFEHIEDNNRMNKLLSNWDHDPCVKNHLISLIEDRKKENKELEIKKALENYELARNQLELVMGFNLGQKQQHEK